MTRSPATVGCSAAGYLAERTGHSSKTVSSVPRPAPTRRIGSPRSADHGDGTRQTRDPIGDGSFVEARVAEDEAGPPRRGELEIGDWGAAAAWARARGDDGRLVEVVGQPGDEMQAGRDPDRLELGQVLGQ